MKSVMLVGGPMDGKQLVLKEDCTLAVPILNELPAESDVDFEIKPEAIAYVEYIKYTFHGTVKPHSVYAIDGMCGDEILERLIANYRP